jgi:hypothetical protein
LIDKGADPKVIEFMRILEEYRIKCEEEGNYLEAGRAFRQLGVLRKQEEKRQQKAIQAKQISEKFGFKRFGFHGISHEFVAVEAAKKLKKPFNKYYHDSEMPGWH